MIKRMSFALLVLLVATSAFAQPNPQLTVNLAGHGSWLFTQPESDFVVVQHASGIPIEFTWEADSSAYGGAIAGYRYGWDVVDPGDPWDPGWATSGFVPDLLAADPVVFSSGVHTFHVAVIDQAGATTLGAFLLDVTSPVASRTKSWGELKSIYR